MRCRDVKIDRLVKLLNENLYAVWKLKFELFVQSFIFLKELIVWFIWKLIIWFVYSIFVVVKIRFSFLRFECKQCRSFNFFFRIRRWFRYSRMFENRCFVFWFNFDSNFFNHFSDEKDVQKFFTFSITSITMCMWKLIFIDLFFDIHSKFNHELYFENAESKSIISENSNNVCLKIENFVFWSFDNFTMQLRNWNNKFDFITNVVINLINVESSKSFLMSISNFVL